MFLPWLRGGEQVSDGMGCVTPMVAGVRLDFLATEDIATWRIDIVNQEPENVTGMMEEFVNKTIGARADSISLEDGTVQVSVWTAQTIGMHNILAIAMQIGNGIRSWLQDMEDLDEEE